MISAFEQYFLSLRGKRIAVLGLGVSNRPLVRLLLEYGCDVTGCDRTPREKLDAEVLELEQLGCKRFCEDLRRLLHGMLVGAAKTENELIGKGWCFERLTGQDLRVQL